MAANHHGQRSFKGKKDLGLCLRRWGNIPVPPGVAFGLSERQIHVCEIFDHKTLVHAAIPAVGTLFVARVMATSIPDCGIFLYILRGRICLVGNRSSGKNAPRVARIGHPC
ncbi:hypothetical protein CATMIT_02005, partial [Catenibacterium mitsuokai DSM 15897]